VASLRPRSRSSRRLFTLCAASLSSYSNQSQHDQYEQSHHEAGKQQHIINNSQSTGLRIHNRESNLLLLASEVPNPPAHVLQPGVPLLRTPGGGSLRNENQNTSRKNLTRKWNEKESEVDTRTQER